MQKHNEIFIGEQYVLQMYLRRFHLKNITVFNYKSLTSINEYTDNKKILIELKDFYNCKIGIIYASSKAVAHDIVHKLEENKPMIKQDKLITDLANEQNDSMTTDIYGKPFITIEDAIVKESCRDETVKSNHISKKLDIR